jgi:hypothetical protein
MSEPRMTKRQRTIWETSSWRKPIFWFYRSVWLPIVCAVRGHDVVYGAFVAVVVCKRCRRLIEPIATLRSTRGYPE